MRLRSRSIAAVIAVLWSAGAALAQSDYAPPPTPAKPKPAAKPRPAGAGRPAAAPRGAPARANPAEPATTGAARAAPAVKPDVRNSYSALTVAERIALQSDLAWTGHYNGLIDGEYSDRLVAAVKAFQKSRKYKETGVLNLPERAALSATVRPLQHEVGWRMLEDAATGARLGLPAKLVPNSTSAYSGTRWASAQGQFQIETFRVANGATLEGVFEQQKREPVGRRVSYSTIKPEFFVVSGMQGLKKFYVRASAKDGEVRGLTVMYDQAEEGTMDSVVVVMSSAFMPFAGKPGMVASSADGAVVRRKVEYATGVVVSNAGHIVTDRQAVDGCNTIMVRGYGNAERVAEGGELAIVRLYGARDLAPVGLIGATPRGDDVTLVGIADPQAQGGEAAISTAKARMGGSGAARTLDAAPALGFSGAAALDAQGQLAGIVVLKSAVVAGPAAAGGAIVVPTNQLVSFLDANYVAPASGKPGVEAAKASVVRIICVRK